MKNYVIYVIRLHKYITYILLLLLKKYTRREKVKIYQKNRTSSKGCGQQDPTEDRRRNRRGGYRGLPGRDHGDSCLVSRGSS